MRSYVGVKGTLTIKNAVRAIGGVEYAAKACGLSVANIYVWMGRNYLPSSEYAGLTRYAEAIAGESYGRHLFTGAELLEECHPLKARDAKKCTITSST